MIQLMKSVVSKIMYPLWHVAEEDEINLPRVPQMRNFMNCTVTILCQDYGLVDDMIYFTSEVVLGGIPLSVGHKVNVLAYQDHESRGWKALRVEKSFDDWEDDSASDCELSKARALIGIVTSCDGEGGMINSSTCFSLSHVCEGFQPIKGDWVRAEYFINPSKWCSQASSVAPLRSRAIDKVQVSSICGRCGVIESSIFFTLDSLCVPNEYCPSTGDVVNAVVVESTQSFYCWRALAMTPVSSSSSKGNLAKNEHVKVDSHLLLEDKGGLEVSKMTNFGSLLLGQTKEILVCIMNHSNQAHILISSGLAGWDRSGQFSLHVPVAHGYEGPVGNLSCPLSLLWRAHARGPYLLLLCSGSLYYGINGSSNTCVSYLSSAEGTWEISIAPGQEMTVAVQCQARILGSCTELLLLHFQSFSIGRLLDVDVHASEELLVKAQTNYMPASQLSLLPSTQLNKDVIAVLPSSLPHKLPRRHLPNFLSRYPVPPSLKECFEHEKDVLLVQPQLAEPLSWHNFQCKFSALLWLEELQAEREMKEFSIHGTFLRKSANYLLLDVPGVADGRPSVSLGDKVLLKRTLANGIELEYTAYISEIYNDELSLRVNLDFHSNYNGEPLDVEFTFNRLTMRRCHAAVERVEHLGEAVLFPQCLVIKPVQLHLEWQQNNTEDETFPSDERDAGAQGVDMVSVGTQTQAGKSSPTFPLSQNGFYFNPALNPHQRAAVKRILTGECRPLPYILFGPPGTGKTVTLLEAILQIHHKLPDSRILVCTPSNSAADLVCSRLHYSGHVPSGNLVRVNASCRLEESIPEEVKSYSHSGEDVFQAAHYRIVITTCSSAGMFYQVGLRVGHFTHVFMDEAGQAMEPECFIPLGLLSEVDGQIVLAGDPMQLGPLVKSKLATVYGLSKSLLERLMSMSLYSRQEKEFGPHGAYNPLLVTKLLINYRSHEAILLLPSRLFYNQELELGSDPKVVESLQNWRGLPTRGFPLMFHGVRGREMREGNSPSWFNPVEAVQVLIYCCQLTRRLYKPVSPFDIGVITPYRKQVEKIRLLLGRAGLLDIKVGSVEEFQGREFLVIIISLVRSNEEIMDQDVHSLLGFISNPKRFNVAITRAKALLIVLGNPHVLVKDPCFAELLQYCEENGAFFGCNLPTELMSQS
ncbi:RNA helicase Mov10l1 [Erpetoichthys calabaricus]|uniref:RNA helicase Mov10l1 n=1 Tax=Erpetoichthys calabaricus TaxID=27687 RepID=UPI002234E84D|nr:RNA helicase Mov10l1 [Erpetoichthys calabaricus]